MPHFADYLPHNRKAASAIGKMNTPGTAFASSLTARITRLAKEGRLRQSHNLASFFAQIEDLTKEDVLSVKQIIAVTSMESAINAWFHNLADKLYIVLAKDRKSIKDLVWAKMQMLDKKNGDPVGYELILKKRLTWSESSGKFVDTSSH